MIFFENILEMCIGCALGCVFGFVLQCVLGGVLELAVLLYEFCWRPLHIIKCFFQ